MFLKRAIFLQVSALLVIESPSSAYCRRFSGRIGSRFPSEKHPIKDEFITHENHARNHRRAMAIIGLRRGGFAKFAN